jgi:hypothetical protein
MLVYHKMPMGYAQLDGYRVYGRKYSMGSFGPTDLPREVYKKHKLVLEDAVYTQSWLEKRFKKSFPLVSFDVSLDVDDDILKIIAELVGIKTTYGKRHELSVSERNAVRRSIILQLSD